MSEPTPDSNGRATIREVYALVDTRFGQVMGAVKEQNDKIDGLTKEIATTFGSLEHRTTVVEQVQGGMVADMQFLKDQDRKRGEQIGKLWDAQREDEAVQKQDEAVTAAIASHRARWRDWRRWAVGVGAIIAAALIGSFVH